MLMVLLLLEIFLTPFSLEPLCVVCTRILQLQSLLLYFVQALLGLLLDMPLQDLSQGSLFQLKQELLHQMVVGGALLAELPQPAVDLLHSKDIRLNKLIWFFPTTIKLDTGQGASGAPAIQTIKDLQRWRLCFPPPLLIH